MVRLLLEKGADVEAKDKDGGTALHQAAWNGNEALLVLPNDQRRVLLLAAEDRTNDEVAAVLHTSRSTVERIRRRFVEHGLEAALSAISIK